jgi:hypothetical protein
VIEHADTCLTEPVTITFTTAARRAHVSTWLVHADGVRGAVEQARQQRAEPVTASPPARTVNQASLHTDLALARDEIKRLRTQVEELRDKLRRSLGDQLDNLARTDLQARVDELLDHNTRLFAETHQLRGSNDLLTARVAESEDDLAAARTSLRRMIRAENSPA